jgi:hypothetical protein
VSRIVMRDWEEGGNESELDSNRFGVEVFQGNLI